MKKLGMFLLILLLCISLSGCSELAKLVSDMNSEDNPLSVSLPNSSSEIRTFYEVIEICNELKVKKIYQRRRER